MNFYLIAGLCVLLLFTPVLFASGPKPQLMLASTKTLSSLPDATSAYYVSEKYDGVRAFWTGSLFLTRQGNIIHAPDWYTKGFPNQPLDGELWIGHNQFDKVSAIARRQTPRDSDWKKVSFMVFDTPITNLAFYQRKERIESLITDSTPPWLQKVNHMRFDQKSDLMAFYDAVLESHGEGLMLNISNATYESGRSKGLLKLKPIFDDEAVVVGYQEGNGKYRGMMGAMWVKNKKGQRFKLGSGFSDKERQNPPALGAIVTYQYSGFSKTGLPRFARFLRLRSDLSSF